VNLDLAHAFEPEFLIIEMTSRCNLRCKYCQKSMDSWNMLPGRDQDLPPNIEARIQDALAQTPFGTIQLTGVGEFTFRDDWVQSLERLNALAGRVALISNFAKTFTDEELDGLLSVKHLMVSVDTTDAALLKSVRKAVSLSTISLNMTLLRMRAQKRGVPLPWIKINAVIYLENLRTIEDLAYFAMEHRVAEMQYERMYVQTESSGPPTDINKATPEQATEALQQLDRGTRALMAAGVQPTFHGDLVSTLGELAGC
jgi:MoaA/NifB/PqqE/SkfB family radical SAM enzyme